VDGVRMLEFAMCQPKFISTEIANNKWMEDLADVDRKIDNDKAMRQFFGLYSLLTQESFVHLIPPKEGLQDQVYCSNAACVLAHQDKTAILANFEANGRTGEEYQAKGLLSSLGYDCVKPPYSFEGEADLKWIRDNIYIGGYGQRTSLKALEWIEQNYDAKIIKLEKIDPYLYHLDCSVFPLDINNVLVCTEIVSRKTLQEIQNAAHIISVSYQQALESITNSIRLGSVVHNIGSPTDGTTSSQKLIDICRNYNLSPSFVDLSEFVKSGAGLSCLIMHLTYS
jgi:N-dimethylarginine dimethylaminohydrolase